MHLISKFSDGCVPHLLLSGQPLILRECHLQVVSRDQASLPRRTNTINRYHHCTLRYHYEHVPLAGTKIDLREDKEALQALSDNGHSPIKREQGQKLANKIRAVRYLECSALTQRGLKQVIRLFLLSIKIYLVTCVVLL